MDVLRHDGDALGVDGAQVRVFEQADQVRLGRLLKRQNRRGLEAQIRLEVLRDFAHETLERKLADQELGRLLVFTARVVRMFPGQSSASSEPRGARGASKTLS